MASTRTVVVLTQPLDLTADPVIEELNRRGAVVFRFDTADFPLRSSVTARAHDSSDGWLGVLEFGGRRLNLDEVLSVWYRRPARFQLDPGLCPEEREFASQEARMGLGGILRGLECLWVNHPERLVTAGYKPFQLRLAQDCGFSIPRTLVTNNPDDVREFWDECRGQLVYKTLGGSIVDDAGGMAPICTSRVAKRDLDQVARVQHTACLFQEYVPKQLDVRVTVVGAEAFAAEIHSQEVEGGMVDWRLAYGKVKYAAHHLPARIRSHCVELTRFLGLSFSAIDLMLTPDGRYVFAEINPNGQWLWIEQATALPIANALADLLATEADTVPRRREAGTGRLR